MSNIAAPKLLPFRLAQIKFALPARISLGALSAPNRRRALGQQRVQRRRGQTKNSGANKFAPRGWRTRPKGPALSVIKGVKFASLSALAPRTRLFIFITQTSAPLATPKQTRIVRLKSAGGAFSLWLHCFRQQRERERGFIWPPPGHCARVAAGRRRRILYNGEIIFSARQKRGRRGVRVKYCVIATRFLPREPAREAAERVIRSRGVDQVQWENEANGRSLATRAGRLRLHSH